ncbi:MAG: DUF2452 domain-containing protein [Flavobacteriaceae bacterium]|nr:DUF2452 domain-containing protein [Flavobacteriaceae bacterium]
MSAKKKPDNVVFNSETQTYDASLKSYGTNVGAPVITTTETTAWKNRSINRANKQVQARFSELKAAYDKMMADYELNTLIYNSSFNFEPIVGEVYHLYRRENESTFLSLIAPEHCNFQFLGSFYLNADQIWERQ